MDERAESGRSAAAVARALPSVVALRVFGREKDAFGAGVVVRDDGLVLTALHVVEGASAIAVTTSGGEEFPGKIVGRDRGADLALVRILAPDRTFPRARLGGDDDLAVGETVLAISNPFGIGISATRGVVSARERRNVVTDNVAPLLQTDAAINPGSSGGALVDLDGNVVGLITAILTRTGGHQGVGFAVPSRELERALPALIEGKPVHRPWLGVRVAPAADGEGGLRVTTVVAGGPAARAGLLAGDRLLSLGRAGLATVEDLRRVLGESAP